MAIPAGTSPVWSRLHPRWSRLQPKKSKFYKPSGLGPESTLESAPPVPESAPSPGQPWEFHKSRGQAYFQRPSKRRLETRV